MRSEIPLTFENNRRRVQVDEWIDNLTRAKTFIDTKGKMPAICSIDVEERRLGIWIARYKGIEGGTNSERDQLMRSDIPLAFANR